MDKNMRTRRILVCLGILIAIGLCAFLIIRNRSKGDKSAGEVRNNQFRDFPEATEEQLHNGQLNIYLITKGYNSAYWDTLIEGSENAAQELGANLYVAGVESEGNTQKLLELMEEALNRNPDAIIVSPADTAEINSLVDRINEKGIPLIFVDTLLNGKEFDECFLTDNIQAGRMAAEDMLQKLHAMGHEETETLSVGLEIGSKQSQTIIERLAGFNEYWSNNAPENWTIVDTIKCNEGSADRAMEQAGEYLRDFPKLAGLVGLNNGSTVGLCRCITAQNRKDIVMVGFDYSDEIAEMIEGGEYSVSTLVQRQYNMGYGSVRDAMKICDGYVPEYKYNDTGVEKVDHSNCNDSYIRNEILRK